MSLTKNEIEELERKLRDAYDDHRAEAFADNDTENWKAWLLKLKIAQTLVSAREYQNLVEKNNEDSSDPDVPDIPDVPEEINPITSFSNDVAIEYSIGSNKNIELKRDLELKDRHDVLVMAWSIDNSSVVQEFTHTISKGSDLLILNTKLDTLPLGRIVLQLLNRKDSQSYKQIDHEILIKESEVIIIPDIDPPSSDAILVKHGDDVRAKISELKPGGTILFQRGAVFNTGLGRWKISGISKNNPTTIGSYGDLSLPLPKFLTNAEDTGLVRSYGDDPIRHIRFRDLHGYANNRDPDSSDFDGGQSREFGIRWSAAGEDIKFENITLEFYAYNVGLGERVGDDIIDIEVNKCDLRNAYSPKNNGHSQGIYAKLIKNLIIKDCIFDHNGWNEQVDGAERTGFNHNMYITWCRNVSIENNVISRGSNLGIKIRCDKPGFSTDIEVKENVFVGNLSGFAIGGDPNNGDPDSILHNRVRVENNVFTHHGGPLPNDVILGTSVSIRQADEVYINNNIFIDKTADTNWYAVEIKPNVSNGNISVTKNIIERWPAEEPLINKENKDKDNVTINNNFIEQNIIDKSLIQYIGNNNIYDNTINPKDFIDWLRQ